MKQGLSVSEWRTMLVSVKERGRILQLQKIVGVGVGVTYNVSISESTRRSLQLQKIVGVGVS